MHKLSIAALALLAIAGACVFTSFNGKKIQSKAVAEVRQDKDATVRDGKEQDGDNESMEIKDAIEWRNKQMRNQITGEVPLDAVNESRREAHHLQSTRGSMGLNWENMGPDNIGGRTRAILIDKNNSNHIIIGAVAGGLWYSNDGGNSWQIHPVTATMDGLSVACITQDADGNIYVGTGEIFVTTGYSISYTPGFPGEGIFKSTDDGATFTLLPSTSPLNSNDPSSPWSFVSNIAVDPNNTSRVYAATNTGLKISNDGGTTWTNASISVPGSSREVKVAINGNVFAEVGNKLFRSTDSGATFTNCSADQSYNFPNSDVGRICIACSAQDANYVYAICPNGGGCLNGVYRSTNGGVTWSTIAPGGAPEFEPFGGNCQGWYDCAITCTPNDKNTIFIGGVTVYRWGENEGWTTITHYGGFPYDQLGCHPDIHTIVINAANPDEMFVGCDGGVYKSLNATHNEPTFGEENNGYSVTQFYWFAAAVYGNMIGGSQDNGTLGIDFVSQNTPHGASELLGGDGMGCDISYVNPDVYFGELYNGDLYRSQNRGQGFSPFFDNHIDANGDGQIDDGAEWVCPIYLDENVDSSISRFFLGAKDKLWMTPNPIAPVATWFRLASPVNAGSITCFESTPDAGTMYFGTEGGKVFRVTGLNQSTFQYDSLGQFNAATAGFTVTNIKTFSGRYVSGIAVDKNNPDHLVVTLCNYGNTNYVYLSTDATSSSPTFNSIQNGLPPMPVHDAVIDRYDGNKIILATELGMWASSDLGQSWDEENDGMGRAPAIQVKEDKLFDDGCYVLYVCTHGRGFFRCTTLTPGGCKTDVGIDDQLAQANSSFLIYPNPVSSMATIKLPLNSTAVSLVEIYSMDGKLVKSVHDVNTVNSQINLDCTSLSGGNYLVAIHTADKTYSSKLIVLH